MRGTIILIFFSLFVLNASAQIPTNCFEIESVLVDACSSPEGENEMVRFVMGASSLDVSNMSVSWATVANPWLGICQNAGTALKTDSMNNSVQGCGLLIEPPGGILPTGAEVILITSENVQALANSFANLNDTLYVIYQCAGNTDGHFGNSSTGLRTLIMSFSSPAGCADTVIYDRALLVNTTGGTGGSSASQDGSSVAYAWEGTPTYYNNGCVAPFTPLSVDAGNDTATCAGTTVQLNGAEQIASGRFWFSMQGTFNDATILNPVFTPAGNAIYPIEAVLNVYTSCDTISDTMRINQFTGTVSAGNDAIICNGQSTQLTGSGSNAYSWSTSTGAFVSNVQSPTVAPSSTTTYILSGSFGTSNCPDADTVVVTVNSKDSISVTASADSVCAGNSLTLSASGGSSYLWSPDDGSVSDVNASAPTVTPFNSTIYSVASIGSCADTASVFITVIPNDSIVITASNTSVCSGDTIQLNTSGGSNYQWLPATGLSCSDCDNPTAIFTDSITYTVISTGLCPSQESISISVFPLLSISVSADTTILRGQSATLTASGGSEYVWTPATGLNNTSGASVIASPSATTTYFVTENNYLCASQAEVTVTVLLRECPLAVLPSAFSPNGDGSNDSFGLLNPENFASIELQIYNRWGEKVFETLTNQRWDGTYKSEAQPISTFAYTLSTTCDTGELVQRNGCVTLLK